MKLRLTLKSVCQFSRVALRFLETRSNALDSPIPAIFATEITDLEPLEPLEPILG